MKKIHSAKKIEKKTVFDKICKNWNQIQKGRPKI